MVDWSTATVESCLESLSFRKIPKVLARDYKPSGSYPIIDQGQNLIAGWTDDDSVLISTDLPIVIFGDHTRVFKYIDFPFVKGADGTQLLKPKVGIEPLFFYYACRAINLPSRGYNRHFKALKEKEIPIPPLSEQRNIARTLRQIDDAISLQDKQLQVATDMKRTAMQTIFTRGLKDEPQKETEIGPIPESWEPTPCDQIFKLTSGKKRPSNLSDFPNDEKPFPVLGGNGVMGFADKWYLDAPQTLVIGRVGEYCGAVHIASDRVWVTDNALYVKEWRNEDADLEFVGAFLTHFDLNRFKRLAGQPLITQGMINEHSIPLPETIAEQREIVAILDTIDRKIDLHQRKHAVLDELFKALLHKLMMRKIRVEDLDLSIIGSSRSRPYRQTGVS